MVNTDLDNKVEVEVETETVQPTQEELEAQKAAETTSQELFKEEIQERTEKFKAWFKNRNEEQLLNIKKEVEDGTFKMPENLDIKEVEKFMKAEFKELDKAQKAAEKAAKAADKDKVETKTNKVKIKFNTQVIYKDKKYSKDEVAELDSEDLKNFIESWFEIL